MDGKKRFEYNVKIYRLEKENFMKRLSLIILMLIILASCSAEDSASNDVEIKQDKFESGTSDLNYVELTKVNKNIWIHTTYEKYKGYRAPANGLVVVTSEGLVLVDTPWRNEQTDELIKLSKDVFKKDFKLAIVTHAHQDNIGGIDNLMKNDIKVISTNETAEEAVKNGFSSPQPKLETNSKFKIGNINLETFYPGEGHAPDNIVVWIQDYKLLFGGCLIKSLNSQNLGSIDDANVEKWPISVKKVMKKYPNIEIVVPGHGEKGDSSLLDHTLELLNAN